MDRHTPAPTESPEASTASMALAERWADFTRALSFYPEANRRVQAALAALHEALAAAVQGGEAGAEGYVDILFHRDAIRVAGEQCPIRPGSTLAWLSDRIHRAVLAGVGFSADLVTDSLLAFTNRLLEQFTRRDLDATFAELWPEPYGGLRLIDRRFEGMFGEDGVAGGGRTRSWGRSGSRLDLTQEQALADMLAAEDPIRRRLEALQTQLDARPGESEETAHADVLGRIVKLLPPDAMEDYGAMVDATSRILDGVAERLGGPDADPLGLRDEAALDQLMFVTSRGVLARSGPEAPEVAQSLAQKRAEGTTREAPKMRASDAAIEDDVDLLIADIERLPSPEAITLTMDGVQSTAEQIGVCLHCMTHLDTEEQASRTWPHLERLLREPTAADLGVLKQYLEARWFTSHEHQGLHLDRVVDFLRQRGLHGLVRDTGFLTHEVAKATFPGDFGLYLDTLGVAEYQDLRGLAWLVQRVGAPRIRDATRTLVAREGVLEGDRLTRLLVEPQLELLPLVRLVLEHGDRAQVLAARKYLHRLPLTGREASVLRIVTPTEDMPKHVLLALASPEPDGSYASELARALVEWLADRLQPEATPPLVGAERLHAVQMLATLGTPDAMDTLRGLLSARRLGVFPREAKAIRKAAQTALATHRFR